jgi:hypothetical protein
MMHILAPIFPGACRHGRTEALTTNRRYRDVGAADPAGDIMNRVVLPAVAKKGKMFAFGGRPRALATLAATRGRAPAPWQRQRAA